MKKGAGNPTVGPIVVVDANVLFSQVLSDYLVQARAERLVVLKWSSAIVEEMIRNRKARTAERFPSSPDLAQRMASIDALQDYIQRTYPGEYIEPGPEHFRPFADLTMRDPDDRHVLATAVAAHATYLCTSNTSDFPDSLMSRVGIERTTPDELLRRLVDDNPRDMVRGHQTVIDWTHHATHRSTLDALGRAQAPMFKSAMERLLKSLGNLDSRDDLAKSYESLLVERDRARAGLLPPSSRPPRTGESTTRPMTDYHERQRIDQQRGIGG